MNEIQLKLDKSGKGAFVIEEDGQQIAEMAFGISGTNLTVFHTEVAERLKGQGIAPRLLEKMVEYARHENLKVIALCQYVNAQFKRHPDQYNDIWKQDWHQTK